MIKNIQISFNTDDASRLFTNLGLEVEKIPVLVPTKAYHNRDEVEIEHKLVVMCPKRMAPIDIYEAYEAVFKQRLNALIMEAPRLEVFKTIENLNPINK